MNRIGASILIAALAILPGLVLSGCAEGEGVEVPPAAESDEVNLEEVPVPEPSDPEPTGGSPWSGSGLGGVEDARDLYSVEAYSAYEVDGSAWQSAGEY